MMICLLRTADYSVTNVWLPSLFIRQPIKFAA